MRRLLGTNVADYLRDLAQRLPHGTFKWTADYGREALSLLELYSHFVTRQSFSQDEAIDALKLLEKKISPRTAGYISASIKTYLRSRSRNNLEP